MAGVEETALAQLGNKLEMSGMDCQKEDTVKIANARDPANDLFSSLYAQGFRQNATLRGDNFLRVTITYCKRNHTYNAF